MKGAEGKHCWNKGVRERNREECMDLERLDVWAILEYTVAVTIVGLLIWGIKKIFHDKLDARWHYFIWLVLLVRVLVPLDFQWIATPLSIFQEIPIGKWFEMGRLIAEKQGLGVVFDSLDRIWLIGMLVLGTYYGASWLRLCMQIRRAPKADEETRNYIEKVAEKYHLKSCKDIRLYKSNSPFVFGVISPVLVLPEECTRPAEAIVVHELMHRKNRDVLINLGLHMMRVLHWFNPLVWKLTSVIQNDSEALCDQRVLEIFGMESAKEYGEMLIALAVGKKRWPVKVGTSNMAGNYQNMKTRIERIRDFRRVPQGIGLVTACLTLMLAVAGIGSSSAENNYFEVPLVRSDRDLEWGLLEAQCYHAATPQQAVYLFLRAVRERNLFYRMAVSPLEEIESLERFAHAYMGGDNTVDYEAEEIFYFPGFPRDMFAAESFGIYNLQYDEESGSAVVWAELSKNSMAQNSEQNAGQNSARSYVRWELGLVYEDGWKVSLKEEGQPQTGEYTPDALLYGCGQLGDFQVEISAYNEGRFNELQGRNSSHTIVFSDAEAEEECFPEFFTMEYTSKRVYLTYHGEEDLSGHLIRVEIAPTKEQLENLGRAAVLTERAHRIELEARAEAEKAGDDTALKEAKMEAEQLLEIAGKLAADEALNEEEKAYESSMTSVSYSSSNGDAYQVFDGEDLMKQEKVLISGGGSGYSEPGHGWSADEKLRVYVKIYIDGELVEEGEVWSENH